ncbi:MAG: large conductance mechanosensitive channel protein MscL [Erysipelotrichaceae bacterium]|nr:large conductance mechanosensitive channel protein MscL [Erysipelotrichaceae bacterium]
MKKFIGEFKEFIMRGNVLDLAIGVIIATAFGKITTSLINDVLMPMIGYLIGNIDLAKFNVVLTQEVLDASGKVVTPAVVIGIGTFATAIINFVLIAFIVFLIVKAFNKAKEKTDKKVEEVVEEAPKPTTEELLTAILEELKNKK